MLQVQHLSVSYGVTEVLRDVSFTVPERSIVALLGGNGSGKTTTLNVLSGLLVPRGGAIRFEGQPIAGLPTHEIVKRGIVQVPQGREVWSGMSVRDNLDLGAVTRRDRQHRLRSSLHRQVPVRLQRDHIARPQHAARRQGKRHLPAGAGQHALPGPAPLLPGEAERVARSSLQGVLGDVEMRLGDHDHARVA